jgi:membrane-associated phospholipid phosphatase
VIAELKPIDRAMLLYLAVATIVAASRLGTRPVVAWVLLANGLTLVLIWLLHRTDLGRLGHTLRDVYPLVLLPALYGALDLVNGPDVKVWDPLVRQWEALLFGEQVSQAWWQRKPSQFWSTVLHAVYFSYYLIVPFPAVLFLIQRRPEHAREAVTLIVGTFLCCYVVFLLFPVAGPYYEFPRPDGSFVENWAARLVYATLAQWSSYGAAFPSSHVAATVAATIATWRGSARAGAVLTVPTLLLTVGVVYCQMHYAVDALAGVVVALGLAAWWGRNREPGRARRYDSRLPRDSSAPTA